MSDVEEVSEQSSGFARLEALLTRVTEQLANVLKRQEEGAAAQTTGVRPSGSHDTTPPSSPLERKPAMTSYLDVPPTFGIRAKDVMENVPTYDGHNIPVLQFARACHRAKSLVPLHLELELVRALQNKLQGHAYLAIEDQAITTVAGLIKRLKQVFSPNLTANHYRGELANLVKGPREPMLEYISRAKDLRYAIIEAEGHTYQDAHLVRIPSIDNFARTSFIDGLPPLMRLQLEHQDPGSLEELYDQALILEKKMADERWKFPAPKPPQTICQLCDRPGHDAKTCKRQPQPIPAQNAPSRSEQPRTPAPPPPPPPVCSYCRNVGHSVAQCRNKFFDEQRKARQRPQPLQVTFTRAGTQQLQQQPENEELPRSNAGADQGSQTAAAHPIQTVASESQESD